MDHEYEDSSTRVDVDTLAEVAQEMVTEMRGGGCIAVTQAVQVLDLGDGRRATVCITVTTDQDRFL